MFSFMNCCSRRNDSKYLIDFKEEFEDEVEKIEEVEEPGEPEELVELEEPKRVNANYNHRYWPSPRPVNFVKYLRRQCFYKASNYEDVSVKTRLTHTMALNILAKFANCSLEEFLEINPITYSEKYLGYDSKYYHYREFPLLKGSYSKLYSEMAIDKWREECKAKKLLE